MLILFFNRVIVYAFQIFQIFFFWIKLLLNSLIGSPTQHSTRQIKISIVEDSYHPPVIQDPKMFYIIVTPPYGWTKIGQVKVYDEDESYIHQYRITEGNEDGLFHIQPNSGIIEGKPTEGSYPISVEVTDGTYTDSAVYKIVVNEFNEKLKTQSISVIINGVDVPTFVDSKMLDFVKLLATLSGTISENVFIWSVRDVNERSTNARKRRDTTNDNLKGVMVAVAVKEIQGNVG